jgi:hypothetical protein
MEKLLSGGIGIRGMEQYTLEEFESFMKSMKKVSDILHSKSPDYIFAPLIGSVPLIDILAIIDRHFPLDSVEYPPNSSRFLDREEIMNSWLSNFINTNYHGEKMSIVCIDEVISGSSALKGYNEFAKALYSLKEKSGNSLEKRITYEILGIGEIPTRGKRNHTFNRLVNQKKATIVETSRIITADNILLNPVRLKLGEVNLQGRQTYLPEVESFVYSSEYISLLQNVASYFGTNPDSIHLVNASKIKDSSRKYLK